MTEPLLDYAALAAAPVATAPYTHIMLRNFIAPVTLARIRADVPDVSRGGSFPPEALALGPTARAMMAEMQGERLKTLIAEKLNIDLADAPTMLTMRVHCREKDGQIHTDSDAKLVTILLYLNQKEDGFTGREGRLRLLRSATDLEDYAIEVPPTDATLLIFPNGPTTWHGHHSFTGKRLSVQLNYMTSDGKARSELRRHKLSALWKRATA